MTANPKKPATTAKRVARVAAAANSKPVRKTAAAPSAAGGKRALSKPSAAPRSTYRHGDLRRALLDAGVALARAGGPDAVVLREATRRAGVVPNAAYRHFANRDDLLQAVGDVGLSMLATAMEAELARVGKQADKAKEASMRLKAVGRGYLCFAMQEPGLFRTAFATATPERPPEPQRAGPGGLNPFQLLAGSLDGMLAAGMLSQKRRQGAEFLAWSAVHGMAMLQLEGPLRGLPQAAADALTERLLDMVELGIQ